MRIPLRDVSFVIPFHADSQDRIENLKCIVDFINLNFDTTIILIESASRQNVVPSKLSLPLRFLYWNVVQNGAIFHRTRVINYGIKKAFTPYVAIYDTDCIFEPQQILHAVCALRDGADAIYPYGGDFIDVERSYIADGIIKERESFTKESVGGAVFLNKARYKAAGLENERLIGWAPEDAERYYRMTTLGYKVGRIPGKCWHITHSRGPNSSAQNPYTNANMKEYLKVRSMEKVELTEYIKGWEWTKE